MRFLLIRFATALSLAPTSSAADVHVFPGQSVQAAIVGTSNGDRVLIHAGLYAEAIDLLGKSIDVIGVDGADVTTIDATGILASVVRLGSGSGGPRLEGLTLTGGTGTGAAVRHGGGVYGGTTFVTIASCVVTANQVTGDGGGVYTLGGSLALSDTRVVGNSAGRDGGGLFTYEGAFIVGGALLDNDAGRDGGGAALRGLSTALADVVVADNVAVVGSGGGVHLVRASKYFINSQVDRCRFERNAAGARGGGLYLDTESQGPFVFAFARIAASTFTNNAAALDGGGIWFDVFGPVTFEHLTIAGNTAGVAGGGAFAKSAIGWSVLDSIVWVNAPTGLGGLRIPTVTTSDTQTPFPGVGNLSIDPLFLDLAKDDVHISWTSPCRDLAGPASPTALDFEGDALAADAMPDIGADEFHPHLWLVGASTLGGTVELKIAGAPGNSPLLVFLGAGFLASPIPTPYGDFALSAPYVPFPIGAVPPSGVFAASFVIPATTATAEYFLQAFTGAVVTNPLVVHITP